MDIQWCLTFRCIPNDLMFLCTLNAHHHKVCTFLQTFLILWCLHKFVESQPRPPWAFTRPLRTPCMFAGPALMQLRQKSGPPATQATLMTLFFSIFMHFARTRLVAFSFMIFLHFTMSSMISTCPESKVLWAENHILFIFRCPEPNLISGT